MAKKYIATFDTGTDFTCIEYTSEHRNGSSANADDARREARRKHGRASAYMIADYISRIASSALRGRYFYVSVYMISRFKA